MQPDDPQPPEQDGRRRRLRQYGASLEAAPARLDKFVSLGLLLVACSMLAFYLTVGYPAQMHSDSAMKLLLGEEMARQFTLFPRDWYYVNDIWIIFPSLIAAPLSWVLPPSMLLHGLVDVIAAALVLWAAWAAAGAAGIKGGLRLYPATMLAAGLSLAFAEMVFAQSAYSAVVFTLLLLGGSGARCFAAHEGGPAQPRRRDLALVGGLVLVSVASGPRGIVTYVAPLLFAIGGMYALSSGSTAGRAAALRLSVAVLGAALAGGALFLILLHVVRYLSGAAAQTFASPEQIALHLRLAAMNWLMIFDALPRGGQKFGIVSGGLYAARLAVAAFLFLLPLALAVRVAQLRSANLRFLVLFQLGLLLSTGYMLVFTNLLVDEAWGVPRYVMPLVPLALLITALWLQDVVQPAPGLNATRVGWVLILVMLSLSPQQLVGSGFAQWPHPSAGLASNPRSPLVEALRQAGLHRGYAEYWDASVISVLSGGDIRVAPVLISDAGLPVPFRYLGSERWYTPSWAGESGFLITDPAMRVRLSMPAVTAMLGAPLRTMQVGSYEILVFGTNISERLAFSVGPAESRPPVSKQACAGSFRFSDDALQVEAGQASIVVVHARNESDFPWRSNYVPGFNPGLRVVDAQGRVVADLRGTLRTVVAPNDPVDIPVAMRAPDTPGEYTLLFSFVAEGQAWCGDLGAGWARARLTVEP